VRSPSISGCVFVPVSVFVSRATSGTVLVVVTAVVEGRDTSMAVIAVGSLWDVGVSSIVGAVVMLALVSLCDAIWATVGVPMVCGCGCCWYCCCWHCC
jgi:hypothetical protein